MGQCFVNKSTYTFCVNIILPSGVKSVVIIRFTFSPECPFVDLLSVYGTGE